jgi:2',3'-cyclic-nucleotide 2'-phosphodiesterase / 3'-nucleotidase / 5'-nucleotidase
MANETTRTPVAAEVEAAGWGPAGTIRRQKKAMRGLGRLIGAVVLSAGAAACTTSGSDGFAPVYLEGAAGGLRAHVVGRRDGGFFGDSAASTPPAYHAARRWLYVIALPRLSIEVLDIADPAHPRLVNRIGYVQFLRGMLFDPSRRADVQRLEGLDETTRGIELPRLIGEIKGVAFADGVLAVAFRALPKPFTDRGRVLFLDEYGDAIADPVSVGVGPDAMAFTPDGRKFVVANTAKGEEGDDPKGSISVITVDRGAGGRVTTDVRQVGFERFNDQVARLRSEGVRIFTPGSTVAQDLEPESVAITPDGSTAYVSFVRNNAFATVDLTRETVTAIHGLGTRDLNVAGQGIDASDQDGAIAIRPWPVRAYFQPDGIGVFPADGALYVVTANEGDPREFEDARVSELVLDPTAFPDFADLQQPANLGRLRITRIEGDVDGDGDYDRLYTLGTRSFAIWSGDGRLVFDSGDDFERKTAEAVPAFFNTTDDRNSFDNRSSDRGPEPEPLAVGSVGGRWYVFVGFERISGIIAYDITEPTAPRFAFYLNNRNFAVEPIAVCQGEGPKTPECAAVGDIEPEGLLFIPAEQSPNGKALLVVTHEQTDSVTLIQLDPA